MRKVVLFFGFALSACSSGNSEPPFMSAPPVFQPMPDMPDDSDVQMVAHQFYADADSLKKKVAQDIKSIKFTDSYGDDVTTVGTCVVYAEESGRVLYKEITILRPAWMGSSPQYKRTLLYHELGHCALQLNHVKSGTGAIMEASMIADDFASKNWFDLVRRMFDSSSYSLVGQSDKANCLEIVTLD